jgi:hypothetical protein
MHASLLVGPASAGKTPVQALTFFADHTPPVGASLLAKAVLIVPTLRVASHFTSIICSIRCIQFVLPRVVQAVAMAADLFI